MTHLFCKFAKNTRLMDKPNERSMHSIPTIRGGGAIFIGLSVLSLPFISYFSKVPLNELTFFILSICLLAGVSFIDDLFQLSAKSRLAIQCLVGLIVALFLRPEILDLMLFPITNSFLIFLFLLVAVIWSINHFNFMDGMDGFCALQALFILVSYALFLNQNPDAIAYQQYCMVLGVGLLGFLIFNFPPARLFMGDVGSASLGLISFMIAVTAQKQFNIPLGYWFVLNGLFLFDATITLIRRALNKEKCFSAHKKHAYQRLKQQGVSTRVILLGQAIVNLLFLSLIFLVVKNEIDFLALFGLQFLILISIYTLIEIKHPMFAINVSR